MATYQEGISHRYDDTYCSSTSHYPTGYSARFGYYDISKEQERTFLRWALTIPPGSTINSAVITLHGFATRSDDFTSSIRHTDEDDAANFQSNPFSRAMGGPSVGWSVPDFTNCADIDTLDITNMIQDFIDRSGYQQGNHIAIRIDCGDAASGEYHLFYQYDYGLGNYPAVLTVNYTPPTPPPAVGYQYSDGFVSVSFFAMLMRRAILSVCGRVTG